MTTEHYLNDTWSLYFHSAIDPDWTTESYKNLGQIGSVEEFWHAYEVLSPHLHKAIWFLFRDYVFPCWDDPANIDGGCLSIKVLKQHASEYWKRLCVRMLGETLVTGLSWDNVNGVSISPKKHFVIIKIWTRASCEISNFDLGGEYEGEAFYKPNRDSIINNNSAETMCNK